MKTKVETQQLKCVLTKPELEENARKMATAVIALTEIEADKVGGGIYRQDGNSEASGQSLFTD